MAWEGPVWGFKATLGDYRGRRAEASEEVVGFLGGRLGSDFLPRQNIIDFGAIQDFPFQKGFGHDLQELAVLLQDIHGLFMAVFHDAFDFAIDGWAVCSE